MTEPYRMEFDIGTIKHLGLQMYSTLPPVIGELVANAWDAGATEVEITLPRDPIGPGSEIVVHDNGDGMSDDQIRNAYMVVGRDKRVDVHPDERTDAGDAGEKASTAQGDAPKRRIMGRKGIGKFSGFGVATQIEVETLRDGKVSRFIMDFEAFKARARDREITFPSLPPTGLVTKGTRVTLRDLTRHRDRRLPILSLRRGLARRFSVIGVEHRFVVKVNEKEITVDERDLKRLLERDAKGDLYLWEYDHVEVEPASGWAVSGWIGALQRTTTLADGVERGIVIMARGKMVQEPFHFFTEVGQQFALSYLVGEIHAEFVDDQEDTVATARNALVWETLPNAALLKWGKTELKRIAREWGERRKRDNEADLLTNPLYQRFLRETSDVDVRSKSVAEKLIRAVVRRDVVGGSGATERVIKIAIDFVRFDSFAELAEHLRDAEDPDKLLDLFREWEIFEAREMARVTEGRIETIQQLERLIRKNALEVPTLHKFLREFPWVLDPRWNLVADEVRYSDILREQFPDDSEPPEERRIDFLCVREGMQVVVVEIKRPNTRASMKELGQIKDYVAFMREHVLSTTDPDLRVEEVVGYLLCGDLVDTGRVRQERTILANSRIYVRTYKDLLGMVRKSHAEFLARYARLQALRRTPPETATDAA